MTRDLLRALLIKNASQKLAWNALNTWGIGKSDWRGGGGTVPYSSSSNAMNANNMGTTYGRGGIGSLFSNNWGNIANNIGSGAPNMNSMNNFNNRVTTGVAGSPSSLGYPGVPSFIAGRVGPSGYSPGGGTGNDANVGRYLGGIQLSGGNQPVRQNTSFIRRTSPTVTGSGSIMGAPSMRTSSAMAGGSFNNRAGR